MFTKILSRNQAQINVSKSIYKILKNHQVNNEFIIIKRTENP